MNQPVRKSRVTYWVEILALRSRELADRVAGDDVVHAALAAAFGNTRRLVAVRRPLQRW